MPAATPAPTLMPALDPIAAQRNLAHFSVQVDELRARAMALKVTDDETCKDAVALAGAIKSLKSNVEATRKQIVAHPNEFVRAINSFAKGFTEPLDKSEAALKREIGTFQVRQEAQRRAEQEELRRAQAALQAELAAQAKANGTEAPQVEVVKIPEQKTISRADTGASAHVRKVWVHEVVDLTQVPREYLCLDERQVRDAIKMGVREIPGIKIFEKADAIIRR